MFRGLHIEMAALKMRGDLLKGSGWIGALSEAQIHIKTYAERYSRVDVVFDVCREDSLKAKTRQKRGSGARRKVVGNSRPPKSWNSFLRCDENKTELFSFLADKMIIAQTNKINKIITIKGSDIVCNLDINKHMLAPCNHEEADSHMSVHAKHASCKVVEA